MHTPEFLVWAIEQTCPVRGGEDGSDPERTERQLRAARAVSDARREGRVFEGFCVAPPDGFRIDEALAIYGGESAASQACSGCPANASIVHDSPALACCYGILALPQVPSFHEAIDSVIQAAYGPEQWSGLFPDTRPRWYGLWQRPLQAEHLLVAFRVLEAAAINDKQVDELRLALNVAYNIGGRLHVRLYPPGRVEGPWWRLVPHCLQCRAAWGPPRSQRCDVCGYWGHPAPDRKRHARGQRPYFPLERLLGAQQAVEFLIRYEAYRKQPEPPDQA